MHEGSGLAGSGSAAPRGFTYAYHTAKFVIASRIRHFDVPATPYFDAASSEFFAEKLRTTRNYLEYGSGGSTLLAHKSVQNLVSVESDGHFLAAVQRRLAQDGSRAVTKLIHAKIGLTQEWGMPVFRKPTQRRVQRWENYSKAPWKYYRAQGLEPDLILVDGRFRVACVLESFANLSPGSRCLVLFDDYASRPHYRAVEPFAELQLVGRMAVLRPKADLDRVRCRQMAREYCADPR